MTITEPSLSPGDLAEEEMDMMRDDITPPSSLEDMMPRYIVPPDKEINCLDALTARP
jgi:hypothetical protein